eukprot:8997385-Karenia_brevis.AAC.1
MPIRWATLFGLGDWNNLAKGELAHYLDPIAQASHTGKTSNHIRGNGRCNTDFGEPPALDEDSSNNTVSSSDSADDPDE